MAKRILHGDADSPGRDILLRALGPGRQVLIDPVLPLVPAIPDHFVTPVLTAYAAPALGPLLMRRRRNRSPEGLMDSILSLCCVDTSRVPADVVAQHVTVARQTLLRPETEREISASARSMIAIFAGDLRGRTYRRAIGSITCPVLLLHGTRDRLVPIVVARAAARANPVWTLIEMPGVGQVPQLEAPDDTADAIIGWLGAVGQLAAQEAKPASPPGQHDRGGRRGTGLGPGGPLRHTPSG